MMDEARERAAAERGRHAKALLDDAVLSDAFAKVDAALVEAWRKTPHRDTEARENYFKAVDLLGKVRAALGEVVTHGEMSAATLRGIAGQQPGIVSRLVGR